MSDAGSLGGEGVVKKLSTCGVHASVFPESECNITHTGDVRDADLMFTCVDPSSRLSRCIMKEPLTATQGHGSSAASARGCLYVRCTPGTGDPSSRVLCHGQLRAFSRSTLEKDGGKQLS